jgi:PhnB protein
MPKKIDPLNKKNYAAVTTMLVVTDMKKAVDFYKKAFGFTTQGLMKGPDGKPMHAELELRGAKLMLGPEMPGQGKSAKALGGSPSTLYLTSENVDKTVAKAVKLGATQQGEVMDMFWGDRCGSLVDPEGYNWMIATHIAEPTPKEMAAAMKKMAQGAPA